MEDLEYLYLIEETVVFTSIEEAFEDYCECESGNPYVADSTKEKLLRETHNYRKHNGKWYFNFEFVDLPRKTVNEIIRAVEKTLCA